MAYKYPISGDRDDGTYRRFVWQRNEPQMNTPSGQTDYNPQTMQPKPTGMEIDPHRIPGTAVAVGTGQNIDPYRIPQVRPSPTSDDLRAYVLRKMIYGE